MVVALEYSVGVEDTPEELSYLVLWIMFEEIRITYQELKKRKKAPTTCNHAVKPPSGGGGGTVSADSVGVRFFVSEESELSIGIAGEGLRLLSMTVLWERDMNFDNGNVKKMHQEM